LMKADRECDSEFFNRIADDPTVMSVISTGGFSVFTDLHCSALGRRSGLKREPSDRESFM